MNTEKKPSAIDCVLFDLDGTLLDTSYDFAYALKQTCVEFNQTPVIYQDLRRVVSQGGLAMVKKAFPKANDAEIDIRKQYFLDVYFENIHRHTQLFPGLERGMTFLAEQGIPWGIVTNKPTWLTEKLLSHIAFESSPKTVICGDTLSERKPHRAPMDLAAKQCQVNNKNCLYLGDHPRDIEAGINAEMITGAALYGYLPQEALDASIQMNWNANFRFDTPHEISQFITEKLHNTAY